MKNIVGVDIGGTKMYMVAKVGEKYVERKVPTGIQCTKEYIKDQLDDFIKTLPFEVEGVGMALPGLITDENKLELSCVVPNLNGITTEYISQGRFPVKFINDVKAATLCEASRYSSAHTVAVIMVGTGIAVGISVNGEILQGARGFSGEMGHAYVPYKEGVEKFDNLSGGAAILHRAQCSAEQLLGRIEAKDRAAREIIKEAGYHFGLGLGLIIQFYNPDIIVVGGSTSTYPGYMEIAKETAKKYTLPDLFESCEIISPKDIKRIVALGAIKFMG